jgi:Holliday junction resolvase
MLVDRLNASGTWFAQRAPSSKGVDVVATSQKRYKTVFIECKNTDKDDFRIPREEIVKLAANAAPAGAEIYVAIHWRGRHDAVDKRRKLWRFYNRDFLAAQLENSENKTILFKPYDYSLGFEEVFG